MRDEVRLVVQVGSQFVDEKWPIKPRMQRLWLDEKADLSGLAGEQSPDERVDAAHHRALRSCAARRAVADMADLVGEDLAVEQFDPFGDRGFVGEQLSADSA